jgi:DNA-binding response OmpR family regulator
MVIGWRQFGPLRYLEKAGTDAMGSPTARKIAIVCNDPDFCYLMQRYVRQGGYEMLVAPISLEAPALVSRERVAAVVLEFDIVPAAERVLQALEAQPSRIAAPIIVCSWREEEELALGARVDGYIRKPVLLDDFLAALRQAGVPPLATE